MQKQIRKPENWQDFESLCKKLWGEVWEVPNEIKKNGRLGQPQSGVDVYAVPRGKDRYWGIQCKGKDEYTHAKLTKSEVDEEVEKARSFEPPLEVFIIATTANKDSEIESYVRKKDEESRDKGGFKILLFCWEDIVDIIEENRHTFNWYVNEVQYRDEYSFEAYFDKGKREISLRPTFEKVTTRYELKEEEEKSPFERQLGLLSPDLLDHDLPMNKVNHTWCPFRIEMANTGSKVIEDWRFMANFDGEIDRISDRTSSLLAPQKDIDYPTWVTGNSIGYKPLEGEPLVQKAVKGFTGYLKLPREEQRIEVEWELLARNFNTGGTLFINSIPETKQKEEVVEVEEKSELKETEVEIEDYVTSKSKEV